MNAMATINFGIPVRFDYGARAALPGELVRAGIKRPLFVTDKGVLAAGVFAKAVEAVAGAGDFPVYSDVPVNPTEAAAVAGADVYQRHACDGIVGIGGGAPLDLAKAIAVLAANPPPLWDYCNRHAAPREIRNPPPLILMPTTAGTGSEVGRSAVIVFDNGIKAGVRCPQIVTLAICDPDLTLTLPPAITASTGMDALAHCIETYSSPAVNPPADAVALDGMQRIFRHLERAVADGADRQARWHALAHDDGLGARRDVLPKGHGRGACLIAPPGCTGPSPWHAQCHPAAARVGLQLAGARAQGRSHRRAGRPGFGAGAAPSHG